MKTASPSWTLLEASAALVLVVVLGAVICTAVSNRPAAIRGRHARR